MATCALNLPINIPWKLIAASPDMMDAQFCNKTFPFAWRTSLALSVYEPPVEELPEGLCGDRLTYLKVTCSVTGYQPSKEETSQIVSLLSEQPTEDQRAALKRILDEYFACYGVLVNVAVFPGPRKIRKEVTIEIAGLPNARPGALIPNPFDTGGARFEVPGAQNNRMVDIFPAGGDTKAELDVQTELVVTFPTTPHIEKVQAKVAHAGGASVAMEAFSGATSLGSKAAAPEHDIVHVLTIEADGIDRVVFTAPQGQASLLELKYFVGPGQVTTDTQDIDLADYPHVIDFEPKVRDLYQAATESGEVLTDSKSGIKTDKSLTHTESTQSSMSLGLKVPIPNTPAVGEISTTRTNTDTDQTQWAVHADSSRERRETQGTTTQLSQMYNLLTGYHVGTNRAVFLMLARPHVLQPTDFRTFVQGLRAIEGMQEFFLIVSRPAGMEGLCVEASLETGHFPENVEITEPEPEYDESFEDFPVTKTADSGLFDKKCTSLETLYTIGTGWVIDRRASRGPDPGHLGIKMIEERSNTQATDSLDGYNYMATSDVSVTVQGTICGSRVPFSDDASFDRTYRVFMRSEQPKPSHQQPSADVERLLITARELCVCFRTKDHCPEVIPRPGRRIFPDRAIVDEPLIKLNPALMTRDAGRRSKAPAVKAFLKQVERTMSNSWRFPRRYPMGEVGFLDSEFFKDRIKRVLPPEILRRPLADVPGLPAQVVRSLGERATVADVLDLDLPRLAQKSGVSIEEAAYVRQKLLGISPPSRDASTAR